MNSGDGTRLGGAAWLLGPCTRVSPTISDCNPVALSPRLSQIKVSQVQEALTTSDLIFSVPSKGLTVKQVSSLRTKLPEGSKTMVVKNTLMAR